VGVKGVAPSGPQVALSLLSGDEQEEAQVLYLLGQGRVCRPSWRLVDHFSHVGAHPGLAVGWSQLPLAPFSGRGLW
jgi:hypothetical protein